ncbi:sugar transferase (plasmid) [Qingshengfaniella alkalisoli]|uniref:Sugar transferase n=1 Tax=Qingshengfaniella alkalisoli TaxID=2599296 RepID=A0A5B8J1F5_9RHOB|nr:sugar transferase [Qingshengfaniella alkalisoli]
MDIAIASLALLLLSPLLLMVAVAIKATSRGPVLFGHTRIGHDGQAFRCLKFRSMVVNGDEVLDQYLAQNPKEQHVWKTERKLKHDPRVTRLGHVLRAYSVDELPQILNVLSGSMSIVGPRPVTRDELKLYGDSVASYLSARPGITGLWQVSGRSDLGYDERVSLDVSYVHGWSLKRDLGIVLKTVPVVLGARGSY